MKDLIEDETKLSYDIKVHTAEEIQAVRDSLPSLGLLSRAMKIHEILIAKIFLLMCTRTMLKSPSFEDIEGWRLFFKCFSAIK